MTNIPCDHQCLIKTSSKNYFFCRNCSCSHPFEMKSRKTLTSFDSDSFTTLIKNSVQELPEILITKKDYLTVRKNAVLLLKKMTTEYGLCDKTFHLSILLMDRIYSKINTINEINLIAIFCLILSSKYTEDNACKAFVLEKIYANRLSSNYRSDEIYILKLLDYNLNTTTAYDILSYLVSLEIVGKNELTNLKKQNPQLIEHICLSYLNNLVQYNFIVPLNPLEIALGVIQICRKKIGLSLYTKDLLEKFELDDMKSKMNHCYSVFANVLLKKKFVNIKKNRMMEEESKQASDNSVFVL